jgi:hypothetical protein
MMSSYAGGHLGGSGGGATDFRLVGGAWNNATGLQSRILVAGGGGGQGCASSHNRGHGGGLVGVTTVNTGYYYNSQASGGTQSAGGIGNAITSNDGGATYWGTDYTQGGFGYGGNAAQCGAGGGGGWYGGGSNYTAGGGGGSSFAAGYFGCSTAYSGSQGGFKFSDVTMTQGVQNGNGAAYITYLG